MVSVDLDKQYTYADYLRWTFEEQVELIKGKIFPMSPAPARRHQDILVNLSGFFIPFIQNSGPCKFYVAPFDVRLPKPGQSSNEEVISVVQPD